MTVASALPLKPVAWLTWSSTYWHPTADDDGESDRFLFLITHGRRRLITMTVVVRHVPGRKSVVVEPLWTLTSYSPAPAIFPRDKFEASVEEEFAHLPPLEAHLALADFTLEVEQCGEQLVKIYKRWHKASTDEKRARCKLAAENLVASLWSDS